MSTSRAPWPCLASSSTWADHAVKSYALVFHHAVLEDARSCIVERQANHEQSLAAGPPSTSVSWLAGVEGFLGSPRRTLARSSDSSL